MRRFQAAPLESWQARRLPYKQSAIAFWLRRKTTLRSAWRSRPTKKFMFSWLIGWGTARPVVAPYQKHFPVFLLSW